MNWLWKSLILAVLVGAAGIGAFVISVERHQRNGPPAQERRAREQAIQPLLRAHATRDQVIQALGLEFIDHSIGSTNRQWLEQAYHHQRVRRGAAQYPGILFHTTVLTMTWLFFDADGRLQEYYLCEQ